MLRTDILLNILCKSAIEYSKANVMLIKLYSHFYEDVAVRFSISYFFQLAISHELERKFIIVYRMKDLRQISKLFIPQQSFMTD